MSWKPENPKLEDYLRCTREINFDDPEIRKQAALLYSGTPHTVQEKLEAICSAFNFVRDQTPHSCDVQSKAVSHTASEVLKNREGMCYAKSFLLAAFLRLWGIPCGLAYQRLFRNGRHILHGMNGVWIENRWIVIDARGLANGTKVFFDPQNPQDVFVFPVNAEAGEMNYPEIYPDPIPCITQALEGYSTCAEMARHLPSDV